MIICIHTILGSGIWVWLCIYKEAQHDPDLEWQVESALSNWVKLFKDMSSQL